MHQDKHSKATFIGRQPIYNRALDVYAYELLYRRSKENRAAFADGDLATSQVIINTFMEVGLENIVGSKPAFINVTGDFFTGDYPLPMSHEQVVFELLETIVPDAGVIAGVRRLVAQGYRIALDDYLLQHATLPLLELAAFVKLDVLAMERDELAYTVERLRRYRLQLVAEKVETPAHYEMCRELGFDLFQGYFFAHPDVIHTRTTSANRSVVLSLIAQLQNPNIELRQVEQLIAQDVILSFRLLRYINCATFGLRREVDSIRQALMLLGLATVRNWATLLLLSQIDNHKPRELMTIALIRARMCELLSVTDSAIDSNQAFTAGLFSLLDAILDQPMETLLDQLPLSMPIKLALLDREGPLGALLKAVVCYERGEWDGVVLRGAVAIDYNSAYLAAVKWADNSSKALRAA
ncbi:EAL and HDOD domain-containing protein [Sulfurivermis fontis]|uniref:EAL and HDOD domain-containing protein n=1 Tax=Sulfurivermis fontis TaxID=1972068 RepID=UPI000FD71237|nr:HDOD domain-containing protein [Sulfurivermis fontis]